MINAEICCGSYEDALASYKGGAKRIELNSALYMGGLTPSLASLQYTKANTDLKVICMIRPRGAGFCYNEIEKSICRCTCCRHAGVRCGSPGLRCGRGGAGELPVLQLCPDEHPLRRLLQGCRCGQRI